MAKNNYEEIRQKVAKQYKEEITELKAERSMLREQVSELRKQLDEVIKYNKDLEESLEDCMIWLGMDADELAEMRDRQSKRNQATDAFNNFIGLNGVLSTYLR